MKITYYGHSYFGVEINKKNLLVDTYISPNELARKIDIKKIKADYLLISHGHNVVIAGDLISRSDTEGMHYDTFGYIRINKPEACSKFQKAGKQTESFNNRQTVYKNQILE